MKTTKEGKKKKIEYSPNLDALAINTKEVYEQTLEGIATKPDRMVAELLSNPQKFRKK